MERSSEWGITPLNSNGDGFPLSYFLPMDPWDDQSRSSGTRVTQLHPDPGVPLDSGSTVIRTVPSGCSNWSHNTLDSGLGPDELEGDEPPKPTIPGQDYDSGSHSRPTSPRDSHSKHETTDHVHHRSPPAPNEVVSKTMIQPQEQSTPPEPSYTEILPPLNEGNSSPFTSESTDSGDTEMHADEESLFDDEDAHLYTGRKWDGATIDLLQDSYKRKLYLLVASQVLQRRIAYQAYRTSSRYIPVPLDGSAFVKRSVKIRTRTGCLTCRKRRIKCGKEKPQCSNCIRSKRECEGYAQRVVFKNPIDIFGADNSNQALNALMQPMPSAATEQSTYNATGSAGVQYTNRQGSDGTSLGRKRKADQVSDDDDHGGPYEGDGDGSQGPSKKLTASKSEVRALRFACPFFKRHPENFRTCGMSDHENSSRVKQHITRKHRMPIYCPRCSEIFKTEHERDTHVRDSDCPVGPKANFICATAEQLRKLSRRNTHQTDRDNWNAIYKTLFPDDPLPEPLP